MKAIERNIIDSLSELIWDSKESLESERTYPGPDADNMDSKIAHYETRVARLREIRKDLEDLLTQVY